MDTLGIIGYAASAYVAIGVVFAIAMHVGGLRRIDAATVGAGLVFRILITPGLIALWPFMVVKLMRGGGAGPLESPVSAKGLRRLHASLVAAIAVVIPIVAGMGFVSRPAVVPIESTEIAWSLQTSPSGERLAIAQLQAEPDEPQLVYWTRADSAERVFLGAIARAGTHRFSVDEAGAVRLYFSQSARWETVLSVGPES